MKATMKKILLSLPALALMLMLTAGCGVMGNTGLNLSGNPSHTYTYNKLPKT